MVQQHKEGHEEESLKYQETETETETENGSGNGSGRLEGSIDELSGSLLCDFLEEDVLMSSA